MFPTVQEVEVEFDRADCTHPMATPRSRLGRTHAKWSTAHGGSAQGVTIMGIFQRLTVFATSGSDRSALVAFTDHQRQPALTQRHPCRGTHRSHPPRCDRFRRCDHQYGPQTKALHRQPTPSRADGITSMYLAWMRPNIRAMPSRPPSRIATQRHNKHRPNGTEIT